LLGQSSLSSNTRERISIPRAVDVARWDSGMPLKNRIRRRFIADRAHSELDADQARPLLTRV
jgi:hypothetical protein